MAIYECPCPWPVLTVLFFSQAKMYNMQRAISEKLNFMYFCTVLPLHSIRIFQSKIEINFENMEQLVITVFVYTVLKVILRNMN